ncbi:FecCD family ABC transporter permease [Pseudonocardia endophytica]|uniref:FecCD family ABC transporter permease n=1 Tax=Pseudonocardia endophytica TaxID=401976 RepID=UPI001FB432C9|nr:iron ABC transporter permease [Pseudonocardia endophytica]
MALVLTGLAAACVVLFALAVAVGSVGVPVGTTVRSLIGNGAIDPRLDVLVRDVRLPRAVTAAVAGAALGVAGLITQTLFRNPLAEPYVLGVSAGAGLGVALYVTAGTGAAAAFGSSAAAAGVSRAGTVGAAALGAAAVLVLVLVLSRLTRSTVTLLVVGVMLGSLVTALVSLLLVWTDPTTAQRYLQWGLGSVDGVAPADLPLLLGVLVVATAAVAVLAKPLDALLLGDDYATTMGVPVRRVRVVLLLAAAVLAGTVTVFCGPVGFVGIAVPHLARMAVGTPRHRVLVPATVLTGALVGLACAVVGHPPGTATVLPLNVVTSLVGAPVVIAVLLRSRRLTAGAVG